MTFDRKAQRAISRFCSLAKPLAGTFFRSVEYRYMDPANLLGGHGTELYGGRFVPAGIRAVYFSDSEATASREVTARKNRLGGESQITLDKYPRIVYAVDIRIQRCVSLLEKHRSMTLEKLRQASFVTGDLLPSQKFGAALHAAGLQGILFPSVLGLGTGNNLVVFTGHCGPDTFRIVNEEELRTKLRQMVKQSRT